MKHIAIAMILFISKFFRALNLRACRFSPTCSAYAVEAFHRYPLHRATVLTCKRFLRCQPFSAGGYDPVET